MSYSVKDMGGYKLITGAPALRDLIALMKVWGDDEWIIDGGLAQAVGVTLVLGHPDQINVWRKQLKLDDVE